MAVDIFGEFLLFLLIVVRVWIFFGIVYAGVGIMLGGMNRGVKYARDYFIVFPRNLFR